MSSSSPVWIRRPVRMAPHVQLLADFLRVGDLALVAENGVAGHHREIGQLRKTVNQTFCNPIAQVFRVGVLAHIGERQDRDRIDAAGTRASKQTLPHIAHVE